MQVIKYETVLQQLSVPQVRNNSYVILALKMAGLGTYMRHGHGEHKKVDVDLVRKWWGYISTNTYPTNTSEFKFTIVTKAILAYTILNVTRDPCGPWSLHTGYLDLASLSWLKTICLLSADKKTVIYDFDKEYIDDYKIDNTSFCVAKDIAQYDPILETAPDNMKAPYESSDIIKWLTTNTIVNPSNKSVITRSIDNLLKVGNDYISTILGTNIWATVSDTWSDPEYSKYVYDYNLITMITLAKIIKGINIIFDKYPPGGCRATI